MPPFCTHMTAVPERLTPCSTMRRPDLLTSLLPETCSCGATFALLRVAGWGAGPGTVWLATGVELPGERTPNSSAPSARAAATMAITRFRPVGSRRSVHGFPPGVRKIFDQDFI